VLVTSTTLHKGNNKDDDDDDDNNNNNIPRYESMCKYIGKIHHILTQELNGG
jgi:hypothetical protein